MKNRACISYKQIARRQVRRHPQLRQWLAVALLLAGLTQQLPAQETGGLRGDAAAITDARAMVEKMGGMAIWRNTKSVHFVHEWDVMNRPDRYLEHEILDLTGPRSWVSMDSELSGTTRAYSPEHGYWRLADGELTRGDAQMLENAMERAPYSLYRLAYAIARGDGYYEVGYGPLPNPRGLDALTFSGPDGVIRGWVLLNARKEPIVWATSQYEYVLGPLARFGNLWVPDWATTSGGLIRYEMVSLTGSPQRPDLVLFTLPK
jgi:hypothetical protein